MANSLLAVCAVFCLASYVTGSDIAFTCSPSTIKQLVTDDLTMRCSLTDSAASVVIGKRHIRYDVTSDTAPSDVSFLHTITISKEGVALATISEHLAAKVFGNWTGVQVTGQVPGIGAEKGYLQVSWKYPGSGQSGDYQCVISGIDQSGHVHSFSKSVDVVLGEATVSDLAGYIHQLKLNSDLAIHQLNLTNNLHTATIAGLNSTIASLNATNSDLNVQMNDLTTSNTDLKVQVNDLTTSNTDLKVQVNDLTTSNSDLKVQVNGVKTSNSDLKVQINSLQTTVTNMKTNQDTHVMFTAVRSSPVTVSLGHVLVFDQLKTSVGGGYNTSTGVFTCPVAGYYKFDVHVLGQQDKRVDVCLSHNNGLCVTEATADDRLDFQSASTGAIMLLQRGDTVKVVGDGYTSYVVGSSGGDSSFSGHLIAVV